MDTIDWSSKIGKRILERLESEQLIWLVTTSASGQPQPSLVWFLWQNGEIIIYSQPDKPKLKGIQRNGRVALHFNSDEHGGDVGTLSGTAEIVEDGPSLNAIPEYLTKYASGIAGLGSSPEQMASEYSVQVRFVPERLQGW